MNAKPFTASTTRGQFSNALPAPKYLQDHVVDGKLRLSLQDAIAAMLLNNSNIQLQELSVENSKFSLLRAHSPFDPFAQASFSATRSTVPANSDLQGASIPPLSTRSRS